MKRLKTNRLFFNKWVYKINCHKTKGAGYYWLDTQYKRIKEEQQNRFDKIISTFLKEDIRIRNEGDWTSIFCNDSLLAERIVSHLSEFIVAIYEPTSIKEIDFFKNNNSNKIICDQYPHKIYQFKIILKNKINGDTKQRFLEWAHRQGLEKIKISKTTSRWLMNTVYWTQTPFIHVSNPQTLSLVCLYLGNDIKKIEEFVLRSSINSE